MSNNTKVEQAQKVDRNLNLENKTSNLNVNQNKKIDNIQTDAGFSRRMTVAEMFLKESEDNKKQGVQVTETINKFDKMDLYKSIFLSDSEDEPLEEKQTSNKTDFIDVPKNVERNDSPPRGIFANIDFDELNSWKRKDDKPVAKDTNAADVKKPETKDSSLDEEMYGPKIPENIQKRLLSEGSSNNNVRESIEVGSSSNEDSWVDVNELKSKKTKKKKSKKHKSKHKKKSKTKKKDR